MGDLEIILGVVLILLSIATIVVVLMQKSREGGLSGAITGGGADTFFGKNKSRTREAILAKATKYIAILFFVLAFAATLLMLFF